MPSSLSLAMWPTLLAPSPLASQIPIGYEGQREKGCAIAGWYCTFLFLHQQAAMTFYLETRIAPRPYRSQHTNVGSFPIVAQIADQVCDVVVEAILDLGAVAAPGFGTLATRLGEWLAVSPHASVMRVCARFAVSG